MDVSLDRWKMEDDHLRFNWALRGHGTLILFDHGDSFWKLFVPFRKDIQYAGNAGKRMRLDDIRLDKRKG